MTGTDMQTNRHSCLSAYIHLCIHTNIHIYIKEIYVCLYTSILAYIHSCMCVQALIGTCVHTYMHSYRLTGMHTDIHMHMDSHVCLINPYRETVMFSTNKLAYIHAYIHTCIHTYIPQSLQPRNIHNFRVKYLNNFIICIFPVFSDFQNFHTSGNLIILEVWK